MVDAYEADRPRNQRERVDTRSDLLVINKVDLAPLVGADLSIMEADTRRMRDGRPYVFSNLKTGDGLDAVVEFLAVTGGLPVRSRYSAAV